MTWAKLDDRFHSHPRIEEAGLAATGLYARSLSYAACYETDGLVSEAWVRKNQGSHKYPRRLVELGLWEREGSDYRIPDFLDFNPSRSDLSRRREQAKQAGSLGGKSKRK